MTAAVIRAGVGVQPRRHTAIGNFGVWLAAIDLGIVTPDLLARSRVERKNDSAARRQIKPAFDEYRIGLKRERLGVPLPELSRAKSPDLLERVGIGRRDLGQAGILPAMQAAAVMIPPRQIIGAGGSPWCCQRCRDSDQQIHDLSDAVCGRPIVFLERRRVDVRRRFFVRHTVAGTNDVEDDYPVHQ